MKWCTLKRLETLAYKTEENIKMKNIVNIIKEEVSNIVNEATETNVIWDTMKTPQWNEMLTKIKEEYNIDLVERLSENKDYDAIVLAVAHNQFLAMDLNKFKKDNSVVFDIKGCLDRNNVDGRL